MSGTFWQAVWRKANQPIPGTVPRPEWVYVEGRITVSEKTQVIVRVLLPMLAVVIGQAAGAPCFVERGYGTTLTKLLAGLFLPLSALTMGLGVSGIVQGYRTWRYRTTVPEGKKPLFRTRLVEGAEAAKSGLWTMFFTLLGVVGLFFVCGHVYFHQVAPYFFNTSYCAIQDSQASQQHQTTPSIQENSP